MLATKHQPIFRLPLITQHQKQPETHLYTTNPPQWNKNCLSLNKTQQNPNKTHYNPKKNIYSKQ